MTISSIVLLRFESIFEIRAQPNFYLKLYSPFIWDWDINSSHLLSKNSGCIICRCNFSSTGSPHFTRFTLYTTFRKITSLLVKFTLYTEKNSVKWIFVLMKFMFHFTLLFMKNKNSVIWGLPVVFYIIFLKKNRQIKFLPMSMIHHEANKILWNTYVWKQVHSQWSARNQIDEK